MKQIVKMYHTHPIKRINQYQMVGYARTKNLEYFQNAITKFYIYFFHYFA